VQKKNQGFFVFSLVLLKTIFKNIFLICLIFVNAIKLDVDSVDVNTVFLGQT
jgi:hypothetical protein